MKPLTLGFRFVQKASAVCKWLFSFRTNDWDLRDYPVFTRRQEPDGSNTPERLRNPPYIAYIVNWHLTGSGLTREESLSALNENFQRVKAEKLRDGKLLHRPGTRVPIEFASTEGVDAHPDLRDDFVQRVLQIEWAFISDESSLWDFHTEHTNNVFHQRIKDAYGVDVSDIESARLVDILERISASPGSHSNEG